MNVPKVPKAHNFLRSSGYIAFNGLQFKSFAALKAHMTRLGVFEFRVLNDVDVNLYKWHFVKRFGRWVQV